MERHLRTALPVTTTSVGVCVISGCSDDATTGLAPTTSTLYGTYDGGTTSDPDEMSWTFSCPTGSITNVTFSVPDPDHGTVGVVGGDVVVASPASVSFTVAGGTSATATATVVALGEAEWHASPGNCGCVVVNPGEIDSSSPREGDM